jgi:hypothetical protein
VLESDPRVHEERERMIEMRRMRRSIRMMIAKNPIFQNQNHIGSRWGIFVYIVYIISQTSPVENHGFF